jgi:hypothetical protein
VTSLLWPLHLAEAGLLFNIFNSFSSQKKKLGGPLLQPVIVYVNMNKSGKCD